MSASDQKRALLYELSKMRAAYLEAIGNGSGHFSVARYLQKLGVKGKRNSTCGCPLANHFTAICGTPMKATALSIYSDSDYRVHAPLPDFLYRFMSFFDNRAFPELDEEIQCATT